MGEGRPSDPITTPITTPLKTPITTPLTTSASALAPEASHLDAAPRPIGPPLYSALDRVHIELTLVPPTAHATIDGKRVASEFTLARSTTSRWLVVTAEGYATRRVEIVPSEDRKVPVTLSPAPLAARPKVRAPVALKQARVVRAQPAAHKVEPPRRTDKIDPPRRAVEAPKRRSEPLFDGKDL
jgi:hypothetical protein